MGAATLPLARVVLIGATGRMGREVLRAAAGSTRLVISAAIASPGSPALGRDAGELAGLGALELTVSCDLAGALAGADVAIDFSSAAAARANLAAARAARKPLLIGTTGFGGEPEREWAAAAAEIALLVAPNTSLAVALLTELVRRAARSLPASFDIDIIETHHRTKKDAPSGTALALAAAARAARATAAAPGPDTPGGAAQAREPGKIGVASVRAGDLIGEHTVLFAGTGEELTLSHRARERGVFARGALAAALWLQSRPPGRYTMGDVLGLKTAT
jgi:4-hydroxy-tetrahydrodipicolinate reductase